MALSHSMLASTLAGMLIVLSRLHAPTALGRVLRHPICVAVAYQGIETSSRHGEQHRLGDNPPPPMESSRGILAQLSGELGATLVGRTLILPFEMGTLQMLAGGPPYARCLLARSPRLLSNVNDHRRLVSTKLYLS